MCSSSKVKCNKEKPTCSRCRKLGYPCFYSPARRIGRPHPNRRAIARKKTPVARPRLSENPTVNDNVPPTPKGPPPVSEGQHRKTFLTQHGDASETGYNQNSLHWLDEPYPSPTTGIDDNEISSNAVAGQLYFFNESVENNPIAGDLQSPLVDQSFPNLAGALHGNLYWTDCLPPEIDNTIFPLDIGLNQSSSQASSADAPSSDSLSCDQTPSSYFSEPDCVTGALEILRRLQTSQGRASDKPCNGREDLGFVERIQVASSAVDRLSTILVCPCSRKTYVGILVAVVCLAILDVYGSPLTRSKECGHQGPLTDKSLGMNSMAPFSMELDHGMGRVLESVDFGGMGELDAQVSHMQILEELPKLANIVMQFSRRYKGDGRTQATSGTLSALADSLKFRLRLVTNEALKRGPY